MYIGPTAPRSETTWVLSDEKDRFSKKRVKVSPGLVQIFNEILVNAIDRQFDKSSGKKMSRIEIRVVGDEIVVESDGGPIPVEIHTETGLYAPTLVFGEFNTGNNFDDDKIRFVGGRNGVGAKATNVFSSKFEVEVQDPVNGKLFRQRWEENMAVRHDPEITDLDKAVEQGSVKVTFKPDLARFGLNKIDKDHLEVFRARAYDAAACTRENIQIRFNRRILDVTSFNDFARQVVGAGNVEFLRIQDSGKMLRAEIAVAPSTSGFQGLGLVNGIRCSSGTHMDSLVDQLVEGVIKTLSPKLKKRIKPSAVRSMLSLVVRVVINNPDFSSQTKTVLTTPPDKFGFNFNLPQKFLQSIRDFGFKEVLEAASEMADHRELQNAAKSSRLSVAKLDDATNAGKGGAAKGCTLILTEGDSARDLATAGISEVGRENYGVFPLKGKLLNTRTATQSQLKNNKEIANLVEIIGLEWGKSYTANTALKKLRYRYVMIFSDQDLDGHHIAGLIINFFQSNWPSLLEAWPDFLQRFATPIVKVFNRQNSKAGAVEEFFTQGEFLGWQDQQPHGWQKHYRAKYYKGLGTSTRKEALEYFSDLPKHVLNLQYDDAKVVERAFDGNLAEDRKRWLKKYDPDVELDYSQHEALISDFFEKQFVHFSAYANKRAIPLLMDGLKPSQRKAIHVVRGLTGETKVSQLTGMVAHATNYHHGESSMENTIVGLAQDFVGTNNLNLLMPNGVFGTRLQGPAEHASARYINTEISPMALKLFREEDDSILTLQVEDGQPCEPRQFLPVVPNVLINGFKGIGTGWSTDGPSYHPLHVARALARLIRGEDSEEEDGPLMPWYDKWNGRVFEQGGKLFSEGRWRLYESADPDAEEVDFENVDSVEITELPIGVWTDKYIQQLEDRLSGKIAVYKCSDHNDQHVHLIVSFHPEAMRALLSEPNAEELLGEALFLRKRVLQNMMLFHTEDPDGEPALTHFASPEEVLQAFYRARLPFYGLRREQLERKLSHSVAKAGNRLRFIQATIDGSLQLGNLSLREAEELLEEENFERLTPEPPSIQDQGGAPPLHGDFNYLLKQPFYSLTLERVEELDQHLSKLQAALERLRGTSPEELWLADIEDFEEAYTKEVAARGPVAVLEASESDRTRAMWRRPRKKMEAPELGGKSAAMLKKAHAELEAAALPQLKEACQKLGLPTSGTKPDLQRRLCSHVSKDYTDKVWLSKRSVSELKFHLKVRELPVGGNKAELVKRLLKG